MDLSTAGLWDEFGGELSPADPIFRSFGMRHCFYGEVATLKIFEDNTLVRELLSQKGQGKVLIVDGGGSLRCALVGDQLAQLAIDNGWAGIVVYGCIRDSSVINKMDIGIKALNTTPVKSIKRGEGQRNVEVCFAGVHLKPGDFLYADEDGLLRASNRLLIN
ncbi:ribonuclease E activity regulator RraA [Marinoscillum sp. MHG1-6]|uniref:ribonuclease E activity regulator RraA n=1 Tax=Marinoscillum sp. MHG1-6 TaxID=2959627 RepID=UPI00215861D9|nr:ribonuclease E activity regulator RraA [Marinoscillum sp. MHG1-6]